MYTHYTCVYVYIYVCLVFFQLQMSIFVFHGITINSSNMYSVLSVQCSVFNVQLPVSVLSAYLIICEGDCDRVCVTVYCVDWGLWILDGWILDRYVFLKSDGRQNVVKGGLGLQSDYTNKIK